MLCGLAPTALGAALGTVGAVLAFLTSLVTLSFLVTTPEAWVPALGDAQHGFPYLSGSGRLVVKDVMLRAGGLLIAADSAGALRSSDAQATPRTGTVASVRSAQGTRLGDCGGPAAMPSPRLRQTIQSNDVPV